MGKKKALDYKIMNDSENSVLSTDMKLDHLCLKEEQNEKVSLISCGNSYYSI